MCIRDRTYAVELSTRPENSMGSDEQWNMAEDALKKVLKDLNIPYELNEGDVYKRQK